MDGKLWIEHADRVEKWWQDALMLLGCPSTYQADAGWGESIDPIVDFCLETARVDASPLWLIHTHIIYRGDGEPHDAAEMQLQLDRCGMLVDYFSRKARSFDATRPKRPGRPTLHLVAERRKDVVKMKSEGMKPGEIAEALKVRVDTVKADINRSKTPVVS